MAAKSGKTVVAAAGTEVVLGTVQINGAIMIRALEANSGMVFIGNAGDGTVSSATGLELIAGDAVILEYVGNLGSIWVDAAVNGEGVTWIALNF